MKYKIKSKDKWKLIPLTAALIEIRFFSDRILLQTYISE